MSSEPKSADKLQAEIAREYRNFKPSDEVRQLAEELFASEPCEATPDHVLRTQVMDSRIPKNEREWWAKREIESQQARIGALTAEVEEQARLLGASGSREAELLARVEALENAAKSVAKAKGKGFAQVHKDDVPWFMHLMNRIDALAALLQEPTK